jgi:thioredoxin-like negative regulator of GroEL
MRAAFGRNSGANERRQALLGAYPGYAALIEAAWSAGGTQTVVQNGLAQALNRLGASVRDDPQDLVRRWSRVAILETAVGDDLAQRSAAIERGYAPLWLSRGAQWRLRPAADRPAEWDVFDALYAANRAALAREAADLRAPGGRPEAVLTLADTSTPLFGGFPPLAATVAASLHDLRGRQAARDELTSERERRLLRDLLEWEGGDDQVTRAIAALAAPPPYARDEPPRAWRLAQLAGAAGRKPAAKPMASAAELMRAVDYTRYDFSLVEQAYAAMRGSEAAEQMVSHNQQRFLGHPDRDRFMTQRAEERGDAAATVALLEQQLRERPQDWETRARLAKVYLLAREMEAAQRTLLAYPAFAASDGVSAESAEKAWHAGEWLLWAGEPRLAQPVFAIGARDASGSVGAGWCGLRLNQIAGNWRQARDWARNLHEGSAAPGALVAAAQMSFLLNESDEGWRAFYEAAKRFEDLGPWSAALLGHRIARTADKEVLDFTTRWKSLSGEGRTEAPIKDAFAFQALMIDRAPAPKVAESLGAFAARNGDEVHQQLGAAYEAFRRGQFPAAADRFSALLSEAKSDVSYAVPYLTASLIKADRGPEAEALLEDLRAKGKRGVPVLLASAYARGLAGDPGRAVDALWRAQLELADAPPAAVPPSFQVLETCEKLFELTHDDRFRQWLLYLARRQQSAWPTSWAYAFEAKHSSDASARAQAFAMAAYLDAGSAHLAGSNEAQRKKAAEMVAKSNPFGK